VLFQAEMKLSSSIRPCHDIHVECMQQCPSKDAGLFQVERSLSPNVENDNTYVAQIHSK
jgi:hypothetical protein